ncbi:PLASMODESMATA CALLOSE-BINDING PROTEIN 5-like [Salvia divinorum]|uniref:PLASMODESMATA CALLOSE-BINDING PROTEIN 5-like n=1 Tax=Salvia divinorum TaxID=28513 RepID=A0ABD1I206_SALDI
MGGPSRLLFILSISMAVASAVQAQGEEGAAARQLWCVAKNNAEDAALQSALDWACGPGGADCGPIQNGGACYDASDVARMASFAFNNYYVKSRNSGDDTCSFSNTAALTDLNPSHGNCKFTSRSGASNGDFSGAESDTADLSSSKSISIVGWLDRLSVVIFCVQHLV